MLINTPCSQLVELREDIIDIIYNKKCVSRIYPQYQPQPGSFSQRPRKAEEREPKNEVGQRLRIIKHVHVRFS